MAKRQPAGHRHVRTEARHSAIIRYAQRPSALLAATLLVPSTAGAWGFEAHQFIVSRAIDLLPAEIRPFFEANRAFIVERSIDPDLWRNAGFTDEPPRHFVDLDAYGKYPFKDLPRELRCRAQEIRPGYAERQTGCCRGARRKLPARLIRGFEGVPKNDQYAHNDIKFFSAIIGHYVADAHVPLHSVLNYNGQLTGQTGIHYRWEGELFIRNQKQLTIAPGPLKSISK